LTYRLREKNGAFYVIESYLSGEEQEHRVDYTLGSRRIQHYLTTLPDGRIIVLPPSWDVARREWFHNLDIVNPEQTDRVLLQVWNKSCYSCHVSREEKRFDGDQAMYHTRWTDFGTNCERCHGPGSQHVELYQQPRSARGSAATGIVLQTRLGPQRNTMVCAQCHSLRDLVSEGYSAGADYNDYFLPILEYGQKVDADPAYWQDGRPRRFSNDAIGFWQSECYLKGGATCLDCHTDVHNPETAKIAPSGYDSDSLCTRCHGSIGQAISAHTHHAAGSAGSACVECHMPRTVFSIRTAIRDHSIGIPIPENTLRFQIPNACTECHKDRNPDWAVKQVNAWYGNSPRRQKSIRQAAAFAQARAGDRRSIGSLLDILENSAEGPLMRANAAGHLSRFSDDARVRGALMRALADPDSLVRAVAALRIKPGANDLREVVTALLRAMDDPVRTVRVGATLSLVNLGVKPASSEAFERGKQEVEARFEISKDDASSRFEAGKFYYLTANSAKAMDAFQAAAKLDPQTAVRYFLACVLAQEGKTAEARARLSEIPKLDPYYAEAQAMLKSIREKK